MARIRIASSTVGKPLELFTSDEDGSFKDVGWYYMRTLGGLPASIAEGPFPTVFSAFTHAVNAVYGDLPVFPVELNAAKEAAEAIREVLL